MAFFGVTIETIETVRHHPNANCLDLCTLDSISFQFVTGKDEYKEGDKVLYFPIDALISENVAERLGVKGKLSGKNKNRIKTVRLRGEISQGLVGKLEDFYDLIGDSTNPEVITEKLGVTKYEPPVVPCKSGNLVGLPCGLSVYDIEGAERNKDILNQLLNEEVIVMEKLEGQNFSITFDSQKQKIFVNQRKFSIIPLENKQDHIFWKIAKKIIKNNKSLIDFVEWMGKIGNNVTLYGEFIGPGIQNNVYQLKEYDVKCFDIKINDTFVNFNEYCNYFDQYFGDINHLPAWHVLSAPIVDKNVLKKILNEKSITEYSHGKSKLNPNVFREGIVVKPLKEKYLNKFGRLILKQRDPIYLSNFEN